MLSLLSSRLRHTRRGTTLVEVLVALTVLAVLTAGIGLSIAKQRTFARDSQMRTIAQMVAKNEIESLRAAGPVGAATYVGTRVVNSAGEPYVAPPLGSPYVPRFEVRVRQQVLCEGGERASDSLDSSLIASTCLTRNAVVSYLVDIGYQTSKGERFISYDLRLSERDRFGEARAIAN